MKTRHIPVLAALLMVTLIITSCNQQSPAGSIPYNEDSVRSHILPINDAVAYTAKFRTTRDRFYKQDTGLQHALDLGQAEAFNRDAIAVLLNQKDSAGNQAAGVRIYYGLDAGGQVRMVLVPYDIKGNDIINQLIGNKAVKIPGIPQANAYWNSGQAIEEGQRCPTLCSSGTSGLGGN